MQAWEQLADFLGALPARGCRSGATSGVLRRALSNPVSHPTFARSPRSLALDRVARRAAPRTRRWGKRASWREASSIAKRVFPAPPGPLIVTRRLSSSIDSACSSSDSRPKKELAGLGRFVLFRLRRGGNPSLPIWYSQTGSAKSFNRCSPRSSTSPPTSSRVALESRTWLP
jgi:hypothetical protein